MSLKTAERTARTAMLAAAMLLLLSGCSARKRVQPFQMPPFTPVELAQIPEPSDPPVVEGDDDEDDLPPVPVAEGAAAPKRQRRKPAKVVAQTAAPPDTQAPTPVQQVAAAGPVASESESASVIGSFSPGGNQDPTQQREATDLIAANEKRLNALTPEIVRAKAALISNVKNFQKQAQDALKTGDAAGAKTLATKGKLLLDELDQEGS